MLKLGYAQTDITPTEPMELVGFYREDNISKGFFGLNRKEVENYIADMKKDLK